MDTDTADEVVALTDEVVVLTTKKTKRKTEPIKNCSRCREQGVLDSSHNEKGACPYNPNFARAKGASDASLSERVNGGEATSETSWTALEGLSPSSSSSRRRKKKKSPSSDRPETGIVIKIRLPKALMPYRWKDKPFFQTILEQSRTLPVLYFFSVRLRLRVV
jgi:hypothetical protein